MTAATTPQRCRHHRVLFPAFIRQQLATARASSLRRHLDRCPDCWTAWNVYRWHRARGSALLGDLREFLADDFIPYYDSSHALAAAWDTARPTTPAARAEFFRSSTDYLYNSTIWTASGNRPPYLRQARPILEQLGVHTLIDYGCGIGQDTLRLRSLGYTVTPCDYHSPSTRFLEWRAARSNRPIQAVEPDRLDAATGTDALWIIDTLDHLPHPHRELAQPLSTVTTVITENISIHKAHGAQRFHNRRTADELINFFADHDFSPQRPSPLTSHLTVWLRTPSASDTPTAPR
ncbi:hypothetical protein GCM10010277_68520 [Streptomyces longisporoflavus]|uniref:zf-HC2 domain-containing protein n=1 Tax=Streptomyces longisporoflavus TaxID=28044 RepID=UPI00167E0AA2|nr:zf-HC2 domain-containing protein [Streptomyces longisporoflavus]GGV62866.1 hypothetical protein GCM10010277_68520 [Streptomyces longisporoflavus]